MKRIIICLIFAAAMIIGFSACGSSTSEKQSSSKSSGSIRESRAQETDTDADAKTTSAPETKKDDSDTGADNSVIDSISAAFSDSPKLSIDVDILEKGDHRILMGLRYNFEKGDLEHVYDDDGRLLKIVSENYDGSEKIIFFFEYDAKGRVSVIHEGYTSSGATWLKSTFERDSTGRKISQSNVLNDGSAGGYCEYIYDASGNRIYDYWYFNGERQETYIAFLYDASGLRTEEQRRYTATDEVISREVYEYDSSKRLVKASFYGTNDRFDGYKEYFYEGDKLSYSVSYNAEGVNEYGKEYGIYGYPAKMFEYLYKGK